MTTWRVSYFYLDSRNYPVSLTAHIKEKSPERALERGRELMGLPERAAMSVERER